MLAARRDDPRDDFRRARVLRENRESRRAPSRHLRDQAPPSASLNRHAPGSDAGVAENGRDRFRRLRPVYLDHAVVCDISFVILAGFFQLDVVGNQEAFEVGAHRRPQRALHFEQQCVGGGPHARLGNQVGALGQE